MPYPPYSYVYTTSIQYVTSLPGYAAFNAGGLTGTQVDTYFQEYHTYLLKAIALMIFNILAPLFAYILITVLSVNLVRHGLFSVKRYWRMFACSLLWLLFVSIVVALVLLFLWIFSSFIGSVGIWFVGSLVLLLFCTLLGLTILFNLELPVHESILDFLGNFGNSIKLVWKQLLIALLIISVLTYLLSATNIIVNSLDLTFIVIIIFQLYSLAFLHVYI